MGAKLSTPEPISCSFSELNSPDQMGDQIQLDEPSAPGAEISRSSHCDLESSYQTLILTIGHNELHPESARRDRGEDYKSGDEVSLHRRGTPTDPCAPLRKMS